jgi:RHS repeat-associated protein
LVLSGFILKALPGCARAFTTAYRSAKPGFDSSLKRYRFSGKERDDESGPYYFGARYCAAWLGRWTSSDPAGFVDGPNLYRYCSNNPIGIRDLHGTGGIAIPEEDLEMTLN